MILKDGKYSSMGKLELTSISLQCLFLVLLVLLLLVLLLVPVLLLLLCNLHNSAVFGSDKAEHDDMVNLELHITIFKAELGPS